MPTTTTRRESRASTRSRRTDGGTRRASDALGKEGGQLSSSTQRAKWIESLDDKADRNGQTLATRSHDVIRQWAEERGGQPATVGKREGERPRVLRFDFPDYGGQSLEKIGWDDWFGTFDERRLVFVYQDRLKNGNQSNFFKLDSPEREDG